MAGYTINTIMFMRRIITRWYHYSPLLCAHAQGAPVVGRLKTYNGGGFVVDLSGSKQQIDRIIDHLEKKGSGAQMDTFDETLLALNSISHITYIFYYCQLQYIYIIPIYGWTFIWLQLTNNYLLMYLHGQNCLKEMQYSSFFLYTFLLNNA